MNVYADRFWSKVNKAGPLKEPKLGPCWEWTSWRNDIGYPRFWYNGSPGYAHRFAWEITFGPIPEGLTINHLCYFKPCVNPFHFELVTRAGNLEHYHARRRRLANRRKKAVA